MRVLGLVYARAVVAMLLLLMPMCRTAAAQEFAGREKLRAHSEEFRDVVKVTDGVWVAVGFSNANSVLIAGEGGSIVVDGLRW